MVDLSNPLDDTHVKEDVCLDDFGPVLLARPYFRVQQNLNTRETSARMTPHHRRRRDHRGFGSGLETIGRASVVEVGRGSGDDGQRTTAVKRTGNVGWYLALSVQEMIVLKEGKCADAR